MPDAVTAREAGIAELTALVREGKQAAVIFIVHWPKARFFMPEWHTDKFSRTLLAVKDTVMVRAVSVE
jgi:sugar fermentation stimulation protein A